MTFPPMRPQLEIQHEHDMLMFVMSTPQLLRAIVPPEYRSALAAATDVLCWVLHHDVGSHPHSHASDFARILKDLKESLNSIPGFMEEEPDGEYIVDQEG